MILSSIRSTSEIRLTKTTTTITAALVLVITASLLLVVAANAPAAYAGPGDPMKGIKTGIVIEEKAPDPAISHLLDARVAGNAPSVG